MRPERDCAQVHPMSEIKQSSRDLDSDAGRKLQQEH